MVCGNFYHMQVCAYFSKFLVCIFTKLLTSVLYCKESVSFCVLVIHLFLRAFLWADLLDDNEETYSIPVEY